MGRSLTVVTLLHPFYIGAVFRVPHSQQRLYFSISNVVRGLDAPLYRGYAVCKVADWSAKGASCERG